MTDDEETIWAKISLRQSIEDIIKNGPSGLVGIASAGSRSPLVTVTAQFDTGAAGTGISPALASKLNLENIGFGSIEEPGRTPVSVEFFHVRIFLPGVELDLDVAALPSLAAPHDVLIGRDVLAYTRLFVDFTTGNVVLHFKSS